MFYQVTFDQPTVKIKSKEDYNQRVKELFVWQIAYNFKLKFTVFEFLKDIFESKTLISFLTSFLYFCFYFTFSFITLPATIAAAIISIVEFFWITLFYPLYQISYIRIIPTIVSCTLCGLYFALCIIGAGSLEKP